MDERRKNKRVTFQIKIVFYGKNNQPIIGDVQDISLRGAHIKPKKISDFKIGDIYRFIITLTDKKSGLKLEGDAEICRFGKNNDVGIRFVDIEADTLEHLRHIVALNFGDANTIDDELKTFLK